MTKRSQFAAMCDDYSGLAFQQSKYSSGNVSDTLIRCGVLLRILSIQLSDQPIEGAAPKTTEQLY